MSTVYSFGRQQAQHYLYFCGKKLALALRFAFPALVTKCAKLMGTQWFSYGVCLLAVFSGCSKPERPTATDINTNTATPAASTTAAGLDACSLLTSEEIQSVQGEAVQDFKRSEKPGETYSVSQCHFALPTFTNSVSLTLMGKGTGPNARDAKQFWSETFSKEAPLMSGLSKTGTPQTIPDLGDEAFWVGNEVIGALNVLKGNRYITISVGGGDQAAKLEKSKKLAEFALKRL